MPMNQIQNLTDQTTTASGAWVRVNGDEPMTFGAKVTGTGAVSATVIVEASFDGTNAIAELGTITLSGTTTDSDGFGSAYAWYWVRMRISAISGTGATVQGYIGV